MNSTQLRSYLSELVEVDDDVVLLMIGTNNRKLFNEMEILFHDLVAIINHLKDCKDPDDFIKKYNKEVILLLTNSVTTLDDSYENRLFKQADVNEVLKC